MRRTLEGFCAPLHFPLSRVSVEIIVYVIGLGSSIVPLVLVLLTH